MNIPCRSCEMPSSCQRDNRCYRPRTLEAATKECREAAEALQAAAKRLNNAMSALQLAKAAETR